MSNTLKSIDELLSVMVEHNASDLHLAAGSPPAIRVNGRLQRVPGLDRLVPEDTRTIVYRILSTEQQKTLETSRQIDFSYEIPGVARFRVNAYFQRTSVGAAFRLVPAEIKTARAARAAGAALRARRHGARPRPRHRPDRVGQVDDARGAARPHQPDPARAHPHDRGPDRVPAQAQELHRQPARDRAGRDVVRRVAALRAPPGPRRDPRRRDARPRDDRDRAHRRRDRPPRLRDAAHPERAADDRPHHRRLPRRAAGPGAGPARRHAAGDRHPEPRPHRRRRRPRARARDPRARRRRPEPDPPGEDRAGLLGDADELLARHADDGAVARRPGAAPGDHVRRRLLALDAAGAAARPAGARRLHRFHADFTSSTPRPTASFWPRRHSRWT